MDLHKLMSLIQEHDVKTVHAHLSKYYKSERTKTYFLTGVFCQKFIDANIWCVQKIHEYIRKLEKDKKFQPAMFLLNIMKLMTPKHYKIDEGSVNIGTVLYSWNGDGMIRSKYINTLHPGACDAMVALESILVNDGDRHDAIMILRHLLVLKPNQFFLSPSKDDDIVWTLFESILSVANDQCKDFVGFVRDLYFYGLKKDAKSRKERLPALFISMFVVLKGKPRNKPLDVSYISVDDRMSYLYVLTDIDIGIMDEMALEKKRRARARPLYKALAIESKEYDKMEKLRNNFAIIKSQ